MRTIGRQLDQVDPAPGPCEKRPDVWSFMVGGVVPDHMNDALVGVAGFNLGEKLRCTDPIDSGWLDKGGIESFKVERTVDIDPSAPCGGLHCWVRTLLDPAEGGLCLIFGMTLAG